MLTVHLYTTSGCHLCELAEAVLAPVISTNQLVLQRIDIASSDELVDRYGIRIPVIQLEGANNDLGWPFNDSDVVTYLNLNLQGSNHA